MGGSYAKGLRRRKHPASPLIDVLAETGEVAEFGFAVPALGKATQGITVLIEGARGLIDRPGSAVGEVDTTFWTWNGLTWEFNQCCVGGLLGGIIDSLPAELPGPRLRGSFPDSVGSLSIWRRKASRGGIRSQSARILWWEWPVM